MNCLYGTSGHVHLMNYDITSGMIKQFDKNKFHDTLLSV